MEAARGLRKIVSARFTFTPDFLLGDPDSTLSSAAVLAVLTEAGPT